jgi:SAM-dependent methyltransferase
VTAAEPSAYERYLLEEWAMFRDHPGRAAAARAIRHHAGPIHHVLDAGCGAGQELLPFLPDCICIGLDLSTAAPALARRLLRGEHAAARVAFARGRIELLPIATGRIDVLILRLVLPYTQQPLALREAARVLRPGGILSVQVTTARYYLAKFGRALVTGDRRTRRYAAQVLRTGLYFLVSGIHRPIGGTLDTFLSARQLRRMARRAGFECIDRIDPTNRRAPHLLFRRR